MILNQLFVTGILQSLIINIVHILPANGATSMKIISSLDSSPEYRHRCRAFNDKALRSSTETADSNYRHLQAQTGFRPAENEAEV